MGRSGMDRPAASTVPDSRSEIGAVDAAQSTYAKIPYPFIANDGAVAFVVKSGAIRIARDGVTVRPLAEAELLLKTYLVSRADEKSRVVSELVRAFMRKLTVFNQIHPTPIGVSA